MRLTACKDPQAKAEAEQQAKGGVGCETQEAVYGKEGQDERG
jgi:hypothetical protein